jgi:2-oxoglutarate ferredoxin oxidoreductase subunit alpha
MEARNIALQEKYRTIQENEVRYEQQMMDDADYAIVAFGSAARLAEKAIEIAREEGLKVGLFRPITLWPFPTKEIAELAKTKKGILVVEINAGQMVQDVRLAVNGAVPVEQFGRLGGIVPEPEEIVDALKSLTPSPSRGGEGSDC